jgi:hypothetical protein
MRSAATNRQQYHALDNQHGLPELLHLSCIYRFGRLFCLLRHDQVW